MGQAEGVSEPRPIREGVSGAADRIRARAATLPDPKPPDEEQILRWKGRARSTQATRRALAQAGIPPRYLDMEIRENLIPKEAKRFLETWRQGGTLLLAGPPGTGKTVAITYLLRAIYQAADLEVEEGPTGHFAPRWTAPAMLFTKVRELYAAVFDRRRGPLEKALRAGLLAIDDWGAAYEHDWPLAELDGLIDDRWDRCLPTIVTTNLPGTRDRGGIASFEATAERAFSRLCAEPGPGLVLLDRKDLRR